MAQTAMSRLFVQSTSSVRQSILRPAQVRSYGSKVIPTFTSTPSTELNEALERFRNDLFIPLGLPKRQQKSVFKPKYATQLEHEPITVTINKDEKFTLTPKLRHELPSKKEALAVLDMMVATGDFSNLFAFVSAMRMSNYTINSNRWQYIIRKVSAAGKLNQIVEISLAFFSTNSTTPQCGQTSSGKKPLYARNLAQQVALLLDAPEHSAKGINNDPKYQPFVIGTLLELNAALGLAMSDKLDPSKTDQSVKAESRNIRDYAQKLDASWSRGNFKNDGSTPYETETRLQENLAIYNGMRLSLQWPKASLATESFQARCDELKPILIEQLNSTKNKQLTEDKVAQQLKAEA
ncbi:uncharacterized protein N7529_003159 [Penicillium soppii]|uniref:uncharacterized protein n=1 Tax=Penicillium soppii TaxID=69789 RepID=UPI0025472826|nr:uncharacterized protein N7529_003159 [Penicillium soppii]KAJ5874729.1 hypothetical protein N7529_003159 [Penicillium soppii]